MILLILSIWLNFPESRAACDPAFNYPHPYDLPLVFNAANFAVPKECNYHSSGELELAELAKRLDLNAAETRQLESLQESCKARTNDESRNLFRLGLFKILKAKYEAMSPGVPGRTLVLRLMASLKMVKLNPDGAADCESEFINPDALGKAMTGYANLLKSGKIARTRYLTVVDYTKPSNSRRMYVIDLYNNRIVNQTWVAHGMGDGRATRGSDGYGSNPPTSNEPNSRLSSAGFIKTLGTYRGTYGESLKLTGLEPGNSNIESRSIVLHDWGAQNLLPVDDARFENSLKALGSVNTADRLQVNRVVAGLSDGSASNLISSTEGCLGVSPAATRVRDGNGNPVVVESGSEYLRTVLKGGSLIFSYTGSSQKSPYF
ncbi:MAG: hypothetical protein EBX52_05350 [Proteobacteria bacterium]|nr:hypothetical protein [Pseudomonadota bacterium]